MFFFFLRKVSKIINLITAYIVSFLQPWCPPSIQMERLLLESLYQSNEQLMNKIPSKEQIMRQIESLYYGQKS